MLVLVLAALCLALSTLYDGKFDMTKELRKTMRPHWGGWY